MLQYKTMFSLAFLNSHAAFNRYYLFPCQRLMDGKEIRFAKVDPGHYAMHSRYAYYFVNINACAQYY